MGGVCRITGEWSNRASVLWISKPNTWSLCILLIPSISRVFLRLLHWVSYQSLLHTFSYLPVSFHVSLRGGLFFVSSYAILRMPRNSPRAPRISRTHPSRDAMVFGQKMSRKTSKFATNMTSWSLQDEYFWHHVMWPFLAKILGAGCPESGLLRAFFLKLGRFPGFWLVSCMPRCVPWRLKNYQCQYWKAKT